MVKNAIIKFSVKLHHKKALQSGCDARSVLCE